MKRMLFVTFLAIFSIFFSYSNDKERIVILNLKAISVDVELADLITENLITSFVRSQEYQIVERSQLENVLSELRLTNTDDFTDNMALEIGKLSKAKIVIIGTVGKVGTNYLINIRSIEVETGNILYADRVIVKSMEDLLPATDTLADKLKIRNGNSTATAEVVNENAEEKIKNEAKSEIKQPLKNQQTKPLNLTTLNKAGIGVLAGGAVITLGGVGMFVFDNVYFPAEKKKPTSYTAYKTLEQQDLIFFIAGITTMSVGGIAMVASIPLLIHKEKNVALNMRYNKGLAVSLSFKF